MSKVVQKVDGDNFSHLRMFKLDTNGTRIKAHDKVDACHETITQDLPKL